MAIKGFQGTSLLDYPGRIASLVFFSGCNLTCPFCHNPSLVLAPETLDDYPLEAVLEDLESRREFIDGVVMTGGEPTLAPELDCLVGQVKDLGLLVKIDTNGLAPQVLESLLQRRWLDFVALDLKTSPQRYGELHRGPVSLGVLRRTVELLLRDGVEYELRTTCVPGLVEKRDIEALGKLVSGASRWVLQQFVPEHALDDGCSALQPHSPEAMENLRSVAAGYVDEAVLRGL